MNSREPSTELRFAGARSPVLLAAAVSISLGIFITAVAVWHLADTEDGDRLPAAPWPCCLAER